MITYATLVSLGAPRLATGWYYDVNYVDAAGYAVLSILDDSGDEVVRETYYIVNDGGEAQLDTLEDYVLAFKGLNDKVTVSTARGVDLARLMHEASRADNGEGFISDGE